MGRPKRVTLDGYVYHVLTWSSFAARKGLEKPFALSDGPLPIPKNRTQPVGRKPAVADQDRISNSIRRGAPLGNPDWVKHAATELNLQSTIKPRGRPRKSTGSFNSLEKHHRFPTVTSINGGWTLLGDLQLIGRIPEPSAVVLLLVAACVAASMRWRRS